MGYSKRERILLNFGHTWIASYADSTTYYYGWPSYALSSNATLRKLYSPINGKIKAALIAMNYTNNPSNEDCTWAIRLNNLTDTTIDTTDMDTNLLTTVTNTDLDIDITTSDFFNIKLTTPAFATNPSDVTAYGFILIEGGLSK
jgi:hypothetical protein